MSQAPSSAIFTVSRLNQTVRQLLEMEMGQIWLCGEISNFSQPSSGHWYFTLKDERTQVRCAMFRTSNRRVTFRPQNGQQVLLRATITLYEPRGDYQLLAESMQPAGDGLLQQQFEQLKQRLAAEGLFDQQFKQVLPRPANSVGVITSPSGAALHDILHVLQRRDPALPVVIYPSQVQGEDAPPQIVRAIQLANQRQECDVLIVGRGGGSLEDLWGFNDERVARAIFASRIPVVSAVGHETDVTIADFIADLRAPTPSAAAELVSRDRNELLRQLQAQRQRLEMAMDYSLAQRQRDFSRIYHRLQQHPQLRLARQLNQLITLSRRLDESMQQQLRRATLRSERLQQRLTQQQPLSLIHRAQQHLQHVKYQLQRLITRQLSENKQRLGEVCSHLEGVSPLKTLARGYNVTTTPSGQVLRATAQATPGDTLKTRLQDGWVESQVTQVTPDAKKRTCRKAP
ncbi:MAG: exodeoxyribonuclease VII large subunit [Symbiopectobacterium sp.]|uniref:exodeoxyribonuclease VII large subunit n=1 Tax=Symbiopectobacterium sp. TaxID=2952789 RepID=UPI0039EBF8F4